MAQIPTPEEIIEAQMRSATEIEMKTQMQRDEGKDFIVPDDGHGAGVVPEDVWQEIKR